METSQGEFLCWGCGEFGQHCHGDQGEVTGEKALVEMFSGVLGEVGGRVKLFACGSSHTVVVTENNDVYTWGNGNSGQLGTGSKDIQWQPQKIQLYGVQPENPKVQGVACGGRHTFIWLQNGHMFSFGNNFFAQLGYDFRIKNYKENQVAPHLLRTMTYRVVAQVACGEKHSIFLFQEGAVAAVGHNGNGQIGTGNRDEAVVPKFLDDLPRVVYVTCGSNHSLIVDENGEVWQWGYGWACGSKKVDLLLPAKCSTKHPNIVKVAGGQGHSLALSANGNVYSWGEGGDGQLGHGQGVSHVSRPRRVTWPQIRGRAASIGAGENYSAVISGDGELYIFGRNSHLLQTADSPGTQYYVPERVPLAGCTVHHVKCGAWHAAALTGTPEWCKANDLSDEEDVDTLSQATDDTLSEWVDDRELDFANRHLQEKKTMTLAEFYAPSPDFSNSPASFESPDVMNVSANSAKKQKNSDRSSEKSHRSTKTVKQHVHINPGDRRENTLRPENDVRIPTQPSHDPDSSCDSDQEDDQTTGRMTVHVTTVNSQPLNEVIIEQMDDLKIPAKKNEKALSLDSTRTKSPAKVISDLDSNPCDVSYQKGGMAFKVMNNHAEPALPKFTMHKPLSSILSDKTLVPNKTLGLLTIDSTNSYAQNLPTSKVPTTMKLSSLKSAPLLDGAREEGGRDQGGGTHNKTAMIAWRRSQKLRNGPLATDSKAKYRRDFNAAEYSEPVTYRSSSTGAVSRTLAMPQTVSVTPSLDTSRSPLRPVSIPGKLQQRQGQTMGIGLDKPQQRAVFSSATSWKHDSDRGQTKVNGISSHPETATPENSNLDKIEGQIPTGLIQNQNRVHSSMASLPEPQSGRRVGVANTKVDTSRGSRVGIESNMAAPGNTLRHA